MLSAIPQHAMILAAGFGKRMGALTRHIPKPMIEVAGKPLIDYAIEALTAANITHIVINTSYKADILEAHLRQYTALQITVSREETPLETGGGIANALHHFGGQPFVCVNSDVIWRDKHISAFAQLAEAYHEGLQGVLLLYPRAKAIGYEGKGDFFLDEQGVITRRAKEEEAPFIYTGIQLLHPDIFKDSPQGAFSLNVLYDRALGHSPPMLKGVVYEGDLLNVGDPEGKETAESFFRSL